jgi:signal transduction histidine kinase
VLAIGRAMEAFGNGRSDVRAKEDGPNELRHIAQRFNAMAVALAAQAESEFAFVAGVAHDLRNPIGTLKITAAQLASEPSTLAPDEATRMLAIVERQANHLERMVGDLLDRASIEAGVLELRASVRDVREVVRQAVLVRQASTTTHRLELSLPEEELLLACDATRIEQVLDNLVSNAIKYSPGGTTVQIAAEHRDDDVVLSVTDHGVGIDPDETSRVFQPFRRVGALRGAVAGVGLGLSNVRKIVEAHGGVIEVESELGRGSVFRVRLPRPPPAARGSGSVVDLARSATHAAVPAGAERAHHPRPAEG